MDLTLDVTSFFASESRFHGALTYSISAAYFMSCSNDFLQNTAYTYIASAS